MSETEFKKIVIPNATDIIAERFDNVLELIHPNSFVYGGAVRDIVAGLPLEGDLDIVASGSDYDYCYSKISGCGKWQPCYKDGLDRIVATIKKQTSARQNRAIKNVNYFETFNNRRVELIKAGVPLSRNITSSMEVVKTVDIVCCGLAMDVYGNIYEVVEGAYQDCMDRVLNLNNLSSTTNIDVLKDRVAKLEKRGWTSKVNMAKATRELKKLAEAADKEFRKKNKGKAPTPITSKMKPVSKDELMVRFDGIENVLAVKTDTITAIVNEILGRKNVKMPFYTNFVAKKSLAVTLNFESVIVARDIARLIQKEVSSYLESLNYASKYKTAYVPVSPGRRSGKSFGGRKWSAPIERPIDREIEMKSREVASKLSEGLIQTAPGTRIPDDAPEPSRYDAKYREQLNKYESSLNKYEMEISVDFDEDSNIEYVRDEPDFLKLTEPPEEQAVRPVDDLVAPDPPMDNTTREMDTSVFGGRVEKIERESDYVDTTVFGGSIKIRKVPPARKLSNPTTNVGIKGKNISAKEYFESRYGKTQKKQEE